MKPKGLIVLLRLLFGFGILMTPATGAADPQDGAFGQALDARRGALLVPGDPAYAAIPLTVECRVKLAGMARYNILVANETKASATHWELFTTPGDGVLHAYVPGRTPDHVHTATPIVDGQWHWVAMVLEEERIHLFVDGVEVANQPVAISNRASVAGPLAVGGLVEGGFECDGLVDEVRLSRGARPVESVPPAELPADESTLGLWRFAADAPAKDASAHGRDGQLRIKLVAFTAAGAEIAGGMPSALQPLPPAEDAAPIRAALSALTGRLGLQTIQVDGYHDDVLREWLHDFEWLGKKEYPDSRPGGPDPEKLRREVYDPQALVSEADGGPLGTVLRQTGALVENLKRSGENAALNAVAADLEVLRSAISTSAPAPGSDDYRAHYLAACALRRGAALSNPLLDFDSILFVVRGTFEGSVRSNPQTADAQGGHFVTQYFGFNALPGGGLYAVRNFKTRPEIVNILADSVVQNGRLQGRKLDHGAFATPDLSYDGKTIVFAWTENAEHKWIQSKKTCFHLFRVNVDGSNLVQLTDGAFNDFDPCWLPNGRIAFVSERRNGYIRCFDAYLKVRSYTLFSMRDDGGDIAPLSYFETSEWNPSVNNNGQLVYTRWDYVDRENCLGTRFWISNPDGTNPRAPHGNYPLPYHTFPDHQPWSVRDGREWDSRFGAPLVEMGIRAVPNSPLYMFTAAPHHRCV